MFSRLSRTAGFTLVELMVTLTVLAIVLTLAVPAFQETSLNGDLRSVANRLVSSSMFARSEAFKRNSAVKMCVSSDGLT